MPECPFCGEYLMDQDKLSAHVYSAHPDKVSTPDAMARAMAAAQEEQNLCYVAALLTESSLRRKVSETDIVAKWYGILLRLRQIKEMDKEIDNEKPDGPDTG